MAYLRTITLKSLIRGGLLFFFFLFLALGNLLRLLPFSSFVNNMLVTEFFLFFFAVLAFIAFPLHRKFVMYFALISLFVFASYCYGGILYEFSLQPFLYVVKLGLTILSSYMLAQLLFQKYPKVEDFFSQYLLRGYIVCLFLSAFIYIAFPYSDDLWVFLQNYGISFRGDPHRGRFISVYFDPNFFASIAFIPFCISMFLYKSTCRWKYFLFSTLFLLSGILTLSRSGIFVIGICLCFIMLRESRLLTKILIKKKSALLVLAVSFIGFAIALYRLPEFSRFLIRVIYITDDPSAAARWANFVQGFVILKEHVFFGMGYNYLMKAFTERTDMYCVDSSMLFSLINFGSIPFAVFFSFLAYSYMQFVRSMSRWKRENPAFRCLMADFHLYILLIVFFASFFNNVLYYNFWLIPMLTICFYLSLYAKKHFPLKE